MTAEQLEGVRIGTTTEVGWHKKKEELKIRPDARRLLEQYAGVPSDGLEQHIFSIRDKAWEVAPYPSVGAMTWLDPYILLHPAHDRVLARLKDGASILDSGCCFATDLRQLVSEGAPSENMYGFDVEAAFFDIGYDLFRDKQRFKGRFQRVDFVDPHDKALDSFRGKLDIVWAAKFVHLFDHEHQIQTVVKLLDVLKPRAGNMFVGSQNGFPGTLDVPIRGEARPGFQETFRLQDEESIRALWAEVEARTGTRWDVEAQMIDLRTLGMHVDDGSEYKRVTGYNITYTATLRREN